LCDYVNPHPDYVLAVRLGLASIGTVCGVGRCYRNVLQELYRRHALGTVLLSQDVVISGALMNRPASAAAAAQLVLVLFRCGTDLAAAICGLDGMILSCCHAAQQQQLCTCRREPLCKPSVRARL